MNVLHTGLYMVLTLEGTLGLGHAAALVAVFTSSYHCHSVDEHECTKTI